ncbi:MAG: hypothetical protein ACJA13_000168 [Paraglaciecola sp.]|jgi:hypothetical protein
MFDHVILIILLLAPVVAYMAGALLFSLYALFKRQPVLSVPRVNASINNGHSL